MTSDTDPAGEDVRLWAAAAIQRRLDLHFRAASPSWREREDAFAAMSGALSEAIGKVRAVDDAWRARAAGLAAEVTRLKQEVTRLSAARHPAEARADGDCETSYETGQTLPRPD